MAEQQKQITTKEYLSLVQGGIEKELVDNAKALPQGFNKQRFELNCMSILKDNLKDFSGIEPISVAATFAKGAYLGLDFFNGECYAIPYGGVVKFQTDYKGEIKLAKKYSKNPIKDIYAKNVKEGDFFEEMIENGKQSVNFKPLPFSDNKIIGTFAVVLFKDGSMMYDTMTVAEMEATKKNYSKAQNSKAWTNSPGEMYKKTVLRRLCKLIDLDFDNFEQQKAFQEGSDFDPNKEVIIDENTSVVIDAFSKERSEQPNTAANEPDNGGLVYEEVE